MLFIWIVQTLKIIVSQKKITLKTTVNYIASACLLIGAVGFFGSALSATGGLDFLPNTFEWPVGNADGVLIYNDGTTIVPHDSSGRIQIYNKSLDFQRGWHVPAGGGVFTLFPADNSNFYVYTARGDRKYLYDIYGTLLSSETYSGKYPHNNPDSNSISIPTPFYLKVFTHPFASWFVIAIGGLLLYFTGETNKHKT